MPDDGDPLTTPEMRRSLGQHLVPVADELRALVVDFGLRPYNVSLVKTRWSGMARGVGEEVIVETTPLTPTPRITDLSGVNKILSPAGLAEQGEIMLSRISGRYTEEQLRGLDPSGRERPPGEQFFYEVEFPRSKDGKPGERRRFALSSAPYYDAPALQWRCHLTKQRDDRQRNGDMRR